ncbi:hypothetical protein HYV43_03945 [Candidatus Micrarchaeota archaeon]|nr:hypothetical protein [Candidatus Micrarchaeota archaeon]
MNHIETHYDEQDQRWDIDSAVWHKIFHKLASGSTRYETPETLDDATVAIQRALAFRGPCVLELIPPVLHAFRQSTSYSDKRQVNRKIALKITAIASRLQRHPKADEPTKKAAQKLRAHVLTEIKKGYREFGG